MDERYAALIERHLRVARVCADLVDEPGPPMAVLVDEVERLLVRWEAGEAPAPSEPTAEEVLERLEQVESRFRTRRPPRPAGLWRARLARPLVWRSLVAGSLVLVAAVVLWARWSARHNWGTKVDLVTGGLRADRVRQGYGVLSKDKRPGGEAVTVNGKPVGPAFLTHAFSRIDATVVDGGTRLSGFCGYPDDKKGAKMSCRISGGGRVLFDSAALDEGHRMAPFDVGVPADRKLTFEVKTLRSDINFAHAVWGGLGVRP
jgi:hypothetical protein